MNYTGVFVINILITIVNLVIVIYLIKWRQKIKTLNENLDLAKSKMQISLRTISLKILLITLEVQQYKNKYKYINQKVLQLRKLIIITRYLYRQIKKSEKIPLLLMARTIENKG